MRILRDLAHSSRVLILLELRRKPASRLKPLAEAVGLTEQAVSGYVKQLEGDRLVRRADGAFRLTVAGEAFLVAEVAALKSFADRASRDLVKVESCAAIAGAPVEPGQRVGLFMVDGRLVAFPGRKSPSWGTARGEAAAGRDVLVGDLHGIVPIGAAALTVLEAPPADDGGSGAVDAAWLGAFARKRSGARWSALDEVGEGVLREAGIAWSFEFAPLESAAAAVARGVNPVMVGAPESVAMLVASVEASKAEGRLPNLRYAVVRARRRARRRARGGRR